MQLTDIDVSRVDASPDQNRETFDAGELEQLAASIAELGLLQPVKVRARGDRYVLVAGERRLRAVRTLGWETIPAVVNGAGDADAALGTLAENLVRSDPSPLEEAAGYRKVIDTYRLTPAEVARRVGVPESRVRRRLGLLELGPEVRHYLASSQLPVGRAELMVGLDVNRQHLALAAHNEGIGLEAFRKLVGRLADEQRADAMFDPDAFMAHEVVAAFEHEVTAEREATIVREAPLGIGEIAALLKVKPGTVDQWRYRKVLPEPDLTVSGVPMWWAPTIESWARATGRMAA